MKGRSPLHTLVQSLSKGEKRYFKLFTGLQQGTKDYVILFDLLDKAELTDSAKKIFSKLKPKTSYEATAKYLYKVVMESLAHTKMDQDPQAQLMAGLINARILFEKSLPQQAFRQLEKVKTNAKNLEQFSVYAVALKIELQYLSHLQFTDITETVLIEKQMQLEETIKQERHLIKHQALYELLRHRWLHRGPARTKGQKDDLNDLVVAEFNIVSGPLPETFESHKTHLLFQAHYFISVNDFPSALQAFYELNQLFEKHTDLWKSTPLDYVHFIEGILDSLHSMKYYSDMPFFLKKLDILNEVSGYLVVAIERVKFKYMLAPLVSTGHFRKAESILPAFQLTLLKKMQLLDLNTQAEVYLYLALIYLGVGKPDKAHFYLNKVLQEGKIFNTLPVFRTFRLIHLLVQFELKNNEYIEYEIRSIKRTFSEHGRQSFLLEKIVFLFVQEPIPNHRKDRMAKWDRISQKFMTIAFDKYESNMLKIFDFPNWIQAKLLRQSLDTILSGQEKLGI